MQTRPSNDLRQGVRRREVALGPLGLLLVPATSTATLRAPWRTCSQADLPLKFDRANRTRPGICIEIIQALQAEDRQLRFSGLEQDLPLRRLARELAADRLDVFFSLIDTAERRGLGIDFLDQPILYESRHQVAVRADDDVRVERLSDLIALGDPVLVTHGTAYSEFLLSHPGMPVSRLALNNRQNLRMLLAGRGRFFYHAGSTLRSHIAAEGLQNRVRILPAVFRVDAQRVAFSPKLDPARRAQLVAALSQLDREGRLQRLRDRYGVA